MPLDFANPVWVIDGEIDLAHHVQTQTLPAPGTLAQLEAAVSCLHAQPLARSRPLWRMYGRSKLADAVVPLANVLISNVPGPKLPLYLAGARLASYWPLSAVEHGIGVNITVLSYAGTMGFGIVAARAATHDAHLLTAALQHAFDELAAATAAL